jgi:hypothetical protein
MSVPNPWVVQEKPQSQPVPPAMYFADFVGVEDKTVNDYKTQQPVVRWLWKWRITKGEYAGR